MFKLLIFFNFYKICGDFVQRNSIGDVCFLSQLCDEFSEMSCFA